MTEIWAAVLGHVGHYEVSSFGSVKSLGRKVRAGRSTRHVPEKMMEQSLRGGVEGRRYKTVGLNKNARTTMQYVHRLVWSAFNGLIDKGMEVNHKDGNKVNNRLTNLEIVTRKENAAHAILNGLNKICVRGTSNYAAKLDDVKVLQIRERIKLGHTQRQIARDLCVCPQTITNVKQGKCWGHI